MCVTPCAPIRYSECGSKRDFRPASLANLRAKRNPSGVASSRSRSRAVTTGFEVSHPQVERQLRDGSSASIASTIEDAERPIATCAPTNDPAEVPTMRSARARSTRLSLNPASSPDSHATPTKPPPPKTSARVAIDLYLRESFAPQHLGLSLSARPTTRALRVRRMVQTSRLCARSRSAIRPG
jgi:hypothetical protein